MVLVVRPLGVGRGQDELEVRRVVMVRRGERTRSRRPYHDWTVCVWQLDGQCWRFSVQDSALGGQRRALAVRRVTG